MNKIEEIKNCGLPVIIFGAGIVGEVLYHACSRAGINVECFSDNNQNKTHTRLFGTTVLHAPAIKERYTDAIFLISAADIKDVVGQIQSMGFSKWHPCTILLKEFDIAQDEYNVPLDFVEYAVSTALLCHDSYLDPSKLFLRSVDIIITERCSLRCRDCSNLMQYYARPENCSTKELLQTIDRFCSIVDELNEFRLLGGEPFMNKDCRIILKRLLDEPKVKKIVIYTNGTLLPDNDTIELLRNHKVLMIVTNYGLLSRRLEDMKHAFDENKVAYYVQDANGWTNCAKIAPHHRTKELQTKLFIDCCAKNTITLSNGNLYRCPFSANIARLRGCPEFKSDCVNIFDTTLSIELLKTKIRDFLLCKEYLFVCDYCNGRSFGDPKIEPAIQTSKPLEYTKYTWDS
jgi:sulfatase maturation enzyme AslB (radical SAM superfamily)